MSYEPHLSRHTNCVQCGRGFMDDCGDSFCSARCHEEYDSEHAECEHCGREVGEDNLNNEGICENCENELEEEE